MTTFDSTTRNIPIPTPRPEPTVKPADVQPAANATQPAAQTATPTVPALPAGDQATISKESQDASGAQAAPVNFAAWGAAGGDAAASPTQGASDISALGTGTLRKGAKGEQVEALQKMLNEKTGGKLEVDGKFGKDTLQALQKFQKSQGLDDDGVFGKDTRAAMAGLAANAAPAANAAAPAGENAGVAPVGEAGAAAPAGDAAATAPAGDAAAAAPAGDAAAAAPAGDAAAAAPAGDAAAADPAAAQPGAEAKTGEDAKALQEAAKTSKIPGTEDTSWTEKLPKGLKPHAEAFIAAGKKHGVDPRFLAAISMQETGNGTSYSMRKRNNAMGIMKGSKHRTFGSVADSINSQAKSLTREGGYYTGKESIAAIGKTYAPIGAKNDPNNLNRHWVPNITRNYNSLGGDSSGQVKGFEANS